MKREGYIIEEIVEYSNMSDSFNQVLRGSDRKKSRQGRYLLAHRDEVIKELSQKIADGSFRISGYREREIIEDGKKRFPGQVVSIRELVNLPIIVKDFETGIHTEQGEDRCLVAIEINGEPRKFFTNSEEMKNILAQVKEMPDGFPFETIIKTETFGKGRTKYVFS